MHDGLTLFIPSTAGPVELAIEWQAHGPPIPAHAAAHIQERWAHYRAQAAADGRSLFDGPITQLVAIGHEPLGEGLRVTLQLAAGSYKDFLVTCLRDRPWFAAHAPGCRVAALGNSALITRGNRALLGRRSPRVSCYAGRLHMIGGVLEALATPAFPATRAGIQAHLWMELREETGMIAGEECCDGMPRVLGLAQDDFLAQPELFWQWEVHVELESLLQRMDPAEHSGGMIVERGKMPPALLEELTPVARLAWERWSFTP